MSEKYRAEPSGKRRNPLIWIFIAIVGLIIYIFISGDRNSGLTPATIEKPEQELGTIDRSLLVPPGMRARQSIEQAREKGEPYPLPMLFDKADQFMQEGNLADAHLLYFFAARAGHMPAMMRMAEMTDPTLFRAEDSLLDHADVIQAYKWYKKAADLGHQPGVSRIKKLEYWARDEANADNPLARQLLLNVR